MRTCRTCGFDLTILFNSVLDIDTVFRGTFAGFERGAEVI